VTAACQSCRDLIGGYVLDALDARETEQVRRHLAVCELCAREHAELATMPALLDAAQSADEVPHRPPPRLEEAVLDRFARERERDASPQREGRRPGPWRRHWLVPALAAAACALAGIAAYALLTGDDDNGGGDTPPSAEQPRVYRVALDGDRAAPAASGVARLYPGDTGTGVHLTVGGLRPERYDYELWCVRDDGWKMSAGTFRVDAHGRADVELTTAAKPDQYDAISIQARPAGRGAGAAGPRVMVGRLGS
jgi:anti-sigma-K factor RskA